MKRFEAIIQKFGQQGEKTGWTYITVPAAIAETLNSGTKTSFRVKGKIDILPISKVSLLPMGGGDFIIPLNADMRRVIKKPMGAKIVVELAFDKTDVEPPPALIESLNDEPKALAFFKTLTGSHQKYFIKWILSAKTETTQVKRIAEMVNALAKKQGYPEMLRARKNQL
jgi:hypothetical protein